jgi:hypothetical protein
LETGGAHGVITMTDQSKQIRDAVAVLFQNSSNQAAFEEGVGAIFKDSARTKQDNAMVLVMQLTKVTGMLLDEAEAHL